MHPIFVYFVSILIATWLTEANLSGNISDLFWVDYFERRYDLRDTE